MCQILSYHVFRRLFFHAKSLQLSLKYLSEYMAVGHPKPWEERKAGSEKLSFRASKQTRFWAMSLQVHAKKGLVGKIELCSFDPGTNKNPRLISYEKKRKKSYSTINLSGKVKILGKLWFIYQLKFSRMCGACRGWGAGRRWWGGERIWGLAWQNLLQVAVSYGWLAVCFVIPSSLKRQ